MNKTFTLRDLSAQLLAAGVKLSPRRVAHYAQECGLEPTPQPAQHPTWLFTEAEAARVIEAAKAGARSPSAEKIAEIRRLRYRTDGTVWHTFQEIADRLKLSRTTVQRYLRQESVARG